MAATIIDRIVPDGDAAVDYTVKGPMCWLARRDSEDRRIRALARGLQAGTRSDEEAIRRAFEYVVRKIPYEPDPEDREEVTAPIYTLGFEKPDPAYVPHGDCDCQSTALAAILFAMGYDPLFRVVAWRKPDYTHVNVVVELPDGRTIPMDAVMKSRGWGNQKPPVYREKYYRCPMKVRALADDVGNAPQSPATPHGGCGCAHCRARGGRGCCPKHAAANTATNASPVTVNVNTGRVDARRWTRQDERAAITADGSRWLQAPGETREVTREVPRFVGRLVPPATPAARPAIVRQVVEQAPARRVVLRATKGPTMRMRVRTPLARYKEFT